MAQEERNRGENERTNPIEVAKALGGVDFPKRKQDLVSYARDHAGDQEVVEALNRMPDREYGSMADVEQGVREAA